MKCKPGFLIGIFTLLIGMMVFSLSNRMTGEDDWKNWGGYDNPIDQSYLSAILSSKTEDQRIECLEAYRATWARELTAYLSQYETRCHHESDKQMVRDYLAAVHNYMEQTENFLNWFEVDEETILWFQIQAYRCAFIEQIRGIYSHEWNDMEHKPDAKITNQSYQEIGGFDNPIDKRFLEIFSSRGYSEAEFKWAQTNFMFSWGTDTEQLFKILSESIGSDDIDIAGYEESMDQWLDALNSRFGFAPEELNAAEADSNSFSNGTGTGPAIREEKGWVMRLYALQLRTVLKNCPDIEVVESVE